MRKNTAAPSISASEITPKAVYLSRRDFIKSAGLLAGISALAACGIRAEAVGEPPDANPAKPAADEPTPYYSITGYNNYYEFSTDKESVAPLSQGFSTDPWSVEVGGLVHKPGTFPLEELLEFEQVDRAYRLRCVEGWSMVIPWQGFELGRLIAAVEPMTSARYVRFTALMDSDQMPGQRNTLFPWPYNEGLRLDEAYHSLTLIATSLYGEPLPNQNGAPLRLVVPWKYGFKSIKAIVRIDLTEEQPPTLWNTIAPHEYGFYANVNPFVDHPRWSQASERRIGELTRRPTLLFNGYEAEVASMYSDMDLSVDY
ncbi:MAG: protein-methionine-sulfoxide reductase catalytic subunit MsrP [Chloroflexi bacterium]|nr:protein-methionine-sulfoxide reductase catalytic subunit MsrP [Chloroflexota bacterium]